MAQESNRKGFAAFDDLVSDVTKEIGGQKKTTYPDRQVTGVPHVPSTSRAAPRPASPDRTSSHVAAARPNAAPSKQRLASEHPSSVDAVKGSLNNGPNPLHETPSQHEAGGLAQFAQDLEELIERSDNLFRVKREADAIAALLAAKRLALQTALMTPEACEVTSRLLYQLHGCNRTDDAVALIEHLLPFARGGRMRSNEVKRVESVREEILARRGPTEGPARRAQGIITTTPPLSAGNGHAVHYRQARSIIFEQIGNPNKTVWKNEESDKLFSAFETLRQLAAEGFGRAYAPLAQSYRAGWSIAPAGSGAKSESKLEPAGRSKRVSLRNDAKAVDFEKQAFEWLTANRDQQDALLWFDLACCYLTGIAVDRDAQQAMIWLRKSADAGYAFAQVQLGWMIANGHGVLRDDAEAIKWFRRAAEQGNAAAQAELGWMFANGRGVPQDDAEAMQWYCKATDQGHATAQYSLGMMFDKGKGRSDGPMAARCFLGAAEQGIAVHAYAQFHLGKMFADGRGVSQDLAEAAKWFRKAADQRYAPAQNALGRMFANGEGVTRDYAEAAKLYREAADAGYGDTRGAQYNLGWMYDTGHGVAQDDTEAVRWYRKAADQGHALAQNKLGTMYRDGHGVPQDYAEAVKWYRRAADEGLAAAQYNLGWMYHAGHGVPSDDAEAVKWYRKAARQGSASAQQRLNALGFRPHSAISR
jgi:TPR repeat protein